MNKINLMDIMESLNGDDKEAAQEALHEWFVEQSKQVHAKISGQGINEDENEDEESSYTFDKKENGEARSLENDLDEGTVVGEFADVLESEDDSEEISDSNKDDVEESLSFEDLVNELRESFEGLETVSDKLQNVEGAQVGEEGKVPVNKKSTLPNHKGSDRLAGEPVKIKSNGHSGHELQKAPGVKDAPTKHHVQNSKDDPKAVKADKSALLTKMDGSVNTQSPISGKGAKGLKK